MQGKKDGDIPFFKVGDISEAWQKNEMYLKEAQHYLTASEVKSIKAKPLPASATVFAKIGAAIALNRRAILSVSSLVDNNCMGVIPKDDRLTSKYLYYFMCTVRFSESSRGGIVPSIRKSDVSEIVLPLPLGDEQEKIVSKIEELFSDLDAGVAALKRAQANLKRYRAAVLKAAVEGRLTEQWRAERKAKGIAAEPAAKLLERTLAERRKKWEAVLLKKYADAGKAPPKGWQSKYRNPATLDSVELNELPTTWVWTHIEKLIEGDRNSLKAGPFGSALKKSYYVPTGYKIYGQEQVIKGDPYYGDYFVDEEKYKELESCRIKPRDLLISLVGTVGRTLVLPEDVQPGIINPRLIKISLEKAVVLPEFLQIYFQSPLAKSVFKLVSHGGTMEILNMGILTSLAYPLPPLPEQVEIVSQVEAKLSNITQAETEIKRSLERAARLRHAILKRAFEGRLV